jgi:hypothetical protein
MTDAAPPGPPEERDDDLLTRAEASAYLLRFQVRLKPATLARLWSVGGNGPPCAHVRRRPYYPRGELRAWALAQHTRLRASDRPAPRPGDGK